jgi:tRNA(adenine34) deaminase
MPAINDKMLISTHMSEISPYNDEYFMKQALIEANKALEQDEVPIGAVVVAKDRIIARGHNLTETLNDVTAHAETQAITSAAEFLGGKYLRGCTMYVTMEPCVMCGGALFWSQIDKVVYGARDEKRGASTKGDLYHPKTEVIGGVMEEECSEIVKTFFKSKR